MGYLIIIVLLLAFGAYFKSPSAKGKRSERAVARRLEVDSLRKGSGKILTNVYLPKESGDTTEIDIVYITRKGLFVLENKNYAGYIFGNESNKSWTVTLYAGKSWYGRKKVEKHQFYNPIWQNQTHIKCLKSYLHSEIRMFSLITFSNRGVLKNITTNSSDVYVCNHSKLSKVVRKIWNSYPDIIDDAQIEEIYKKLHPLTNADRADKRAHVEKIHSRFESIEVCPVCGGSLVLRTVKNGANIGKQFYGCSNYPKCRYTKDLR